MRKFLFIFVCLLFLPSVLLAASGVKGRVAWRGELIPGVTIKAYHSIDAIALKKVFAVSGPTGQDGTYQLELPPGRYYLTAGNGSQPGDYFCYYSGAPIVVPATGFRQVGFNLIRIPQPIESRTGKRSGLWGEISFQGQPLERTYLYVYKSTETDFKGPAWFLQPVAKGKFRMFLPPGDYWLLARKRIKGGQYGPIEIGDYFNFYYGNPIHIDKNQQRNIQLETITRLSMLEEDSSAPFVGISGQVVGFKGQPEAGLRVFAYRSNKMTGTPAYISATTGEDGQFRLSIPETGKYWLLARQELGGPAKTGELYGKLTMNHGEAVVLSDSQMSREVRINVVPHP
ncbi:carboxypeptidase regulatory-like domain-containing protein [Geopsychrobacter electrodiphilus]|uniref:carboxypeptidase regulatory-like domain-containing protein n=1 Tax=Geopsychrobacter electrodiphilus TaxID=225196 RepID=UPI00035E4F88|nr:carboxypeptidase regulatory-like domain-containing protein [Geopsychrobacter electrodiphilus]